MRRFILTLAALGGFALATPQGLVPAARAQLALGESGVSLSVTGTVASDYLFRGLSQTRSRMAYQGTVEMEHSAGLYVGAFVSNVRFLGTDARQELDVYGGVRFELFDTKFDIGAIGYFYPGYSQPAGGISRLDYWEAYIKASREFGPVTLQAAFHGSPNFFGLSGQGFYLEGGADYATGLYDITLGGRIGYQWIERNAVFGTPDYAWWSISLSREFQVAGLGTLTAAVGYYQSSVQRSRCFPVNGRGQDVCGARALASLSFSF